MLLAAVPQVIAGLQTHFLTFRSQQNFRDSR
ncbi:MAG: hypothetical protein K0S11_1647 [Gammaproteobacteria bacterium]|jgi:hypothetical protein|nr:hypothetical protein [Gammaproteobacteria bacterium]